MGAVSKTRPAGRRPTIDDVAAAAGVSSGTVSRALNGQKWVSPESQRAVEAAAKAIGYRPNGHARGLKTQRAGSVAFLLTEDVGTVFKDPNFSVLIGDASTSLARRGLSMVLLLAGSKEEQTRALDFLGTGQIDGVMLVSWHGDLEVVAALEKARIPLIFCGALPTELRHLSYVSADDFNGARAMTRYLLDQGHKHIAFIAPPHDIIGAPERLNGYRSALGDAHDVALEVEGDYSVESGAVAIRELRERRVRFDAVFAANDAMASGAIAELQRDGVRVPEDVAVAGFDDSAAAVESTPQITTMRQPFDRIMDEMSRLLLDQINGASTAHLMVSTELVVRDSA